MVSDNTLSGIEPETLPETIIKNVTVKNGSCTVTDSKGNAKSSALVTGDKLCIFDSEGDLAYSLDIVIYGDVSGDGLIDIIDLLYVQKHILNLNVQSGVRLAASDVNRDSTVDIVDLLMIQKHILALRPITQK